MWTASATPDTERTRYTSAKHNDLTGGLTSVEPGSMDSEAFKRAPEASWISLILAPPLPILVISLWSRKRKDRSLHTTHARVWNDKFNSDRSRSWYGSDIIWLIIDSSDNQTECLLSAKLKTMKQPSSPLQPRPKAQRRLGYVPDSQGLIQIQSL
jgi:hypothetical protein